VYHHVPDKLVEIFNSIYVNSNISVASNEQMTDMIRVEKGVLQGDPSSPLLFNICFNSLVRLLDSDKYRALGHIWGNKSSQSCNWLQYADDAAIVTSSQKSAQGLTNLFDTWCTWAKMEIRLDKCCSFGFLKTGGNLTQILPKIYIKTGDIPAIPQGGYFKYLGRYFDFKMNDSKGKAELLEKVEKYLKTISDLRIRPQTKIKLLDRYISSQISFTLRNYNFSSTWISEHLDALCIRFVRLWLESPISSCVAEWLVVPNTKCGLGVPSFKNRAERLCLSERAALKNSNNQNIQLLWKDSTLKLVNADSLLLNNSITAAQPILVKTQQEVAVQHFLSLEYQGKSARLMTSLLSPN